MKSLSSKNEQQSELEDQLSLCRNSLVKLEKEEVQLKEQRKHLAVRQKKALKTARSVLTFLLF